MVNTNKIRWVEHLLQTFYRWDIIRGLNAIAMQLDKSRCARGICNGHRELNSLGGTTNFLCSLFVGPSSWCATQCFAILRCLCLYESVVRTYNWYNHVMSLVLLPQHVLQLFYGFRLFCPVSMTQIVFWSSNWPNDWLITPRSSAYHGK
jgi:hypothetical protein